MALKPPPLLLTLTLLSLFYLTFFYFHSTATTTTPPISPLPTTPHNSIKVYITPLPRSLNYCLLQQYWSLKSNKREGSESDDELRKTLLSNHSEKLLLYPTNPTIEQYSAEYWILGDLMAPEVKKTESFAKGWTIIMRQMWCLWFLVMLSAELQLGIRRGVFGKKIVENEDYQRQRNMVDLVKKSVAWRRSGWRDHVFVLTDPVAMWHNKEEIAPAVLLLVDFGGWYNIDTQKFQNYSPDSSQIHHTDVSLLRNVIVPYTHLFPRLHMSENKKQKTLLYFKGAKHRHRGGLVREKLWDLLINKPGIIMEEGFPNATEKEQSIKGMRSSEFCLHPAGDTPTSCRLFDAIQSLCIPVIVSDEIVLPFEGMVDYSEFSVFVSVGDSLLPNWLVNHLKTYSYRQKDKFRRNMAKVQHIFEYDSGYPGNVGPALADGAVNHIWKKVYQKLPTIKETIMRERRKPRGVQVSLRCHCT